MHNTNNMKQQKFSFANRFNSFRFAFNGLKILITEEHNARIHLFATAIVITSGFIFSISVVEWLAVILSIGFVIVMEIINSSLENMCDFLSQERSPKIKRIKDLSAAAVLLSALTALIVGLIVFVPKMLT